MRRGVRAGYDLVSRVGGRARRQRGRARGCERWKSVARYVDGRRFLMNAARVRGVRRARSGRRGVRGGLQSRTAGGVRVVRTSVLLHLTRKGRIFCRLVGECRS